MPHLMITKALANVEDLQKISFLQTRDEGDTVHDTADTYTTNMFLMTEQMFSVETQELDVG
ncbi:hypothetical protein J6590_001269 [Homalodisca vitripennis]|nr:hypothetical protein J6590_001269 [Homalodisca vitripennis]